MPINLSLESIIHEHYKSSTVFSRTRTYVVNISCNFVGPKAVNALHVTQVSRLG